MLLRRAKPLLGTLVEIAVCNDVEALVATGLAFKAVERIHGLMSRHDEASELSQFNRLDVGEWLQVSRDFCAVLAFANELSARSEGLFDVFTTSHSPQSGCWQDLELDEANQRVQKHAPLVADLGGIAKGYAVDCAIEALLQAQVSRGWVNAGGDARVLGDIAMPLHIRHPHDAARLLPQAALVGLSNWSAVATSSLNGRGQTVWASRCMAADALTKIVARTNDVDHPVLASCGAKAVIYR